MDNLEDCFNRTQSSRSLVQSFINQDALVYQGNIKLDFERFSERDDTIRLESSYETEPSMIKSYKTISISQLSDS